jgi:hypothetical protein
MITSMEARPGPASITFAQRIGVPPPMPKLTKRTEGERFGNNVPVRFLELPAVANGDRRAVSIERDELIRDEKYL